MWRKGRMEQQRREERQQDGHRGGGGGVGRGAGRGQPRGGGSGGYHQQGGGGGGRASYHSRGGYRQGGEQNGKRGKGGPQQSSPAAHCMPARPKPWVDYHLQTQLYLRDSLQAAAQKSKKGEDYDKFRQQRAKVIRLEDDLMQGYFKSNPSQEQFWLPLLAMEAARAIHYCDMCETSFESDKLLLFHEDAHEVCGLEGCTFTASVEVLEEHVLLIHASGLYARMTHGYSEKDITKWRDERKSNYPTSAVIAVRMEKEAVKRHQRNQQQQRFWEEKEEKQRQYHIQLQRQRQELAVATVQATSGGSGDGNDGDPSSSTKKTRERKQKRVQHIIRLTAKKRVIDECLDESDPEGWYSGIPMFRGTKAMREKEKIEEEEESFDKDDCLGISDNEFPSQREEPKMAMADKSEDDEPPEEVGIQKTVKEELEEEAAESHSCNLEPAELSPSPRRDRPGAATRAKAKTKRLAPIESFPGESKLIRSLKPKRPPTLLEMLLAKEIKEERSELLQCVKYICEKNFFGVGQQQERGSIELEEH